MKWISVEDELPVNCSRCLAYEPNLGYVYIDRFGNAVDGFEGDINGYRATHWMPLPEPPKE